MLIKYVISILFYIFNFFFIQARPTKALFKCRTCHGEHWTTSCPFQHTELAQAKASEAAKAAGKALLSH